LQYLFHYIKENNEIQITNYLHVPYTAFLKTINDDKEEVAFGTSCCHPLCTCENCDKQADHSNVNVTSYKDLTMLHIATIYNMPKILTALTNNGANINARDDSKMTALHFAASLGHQKILFLLLHAGSNVNLRNNKQQTPLILAAMNGHEQCVKALLFFAEHTHTSIDMNAQDTEGMTALHYSARCGFEMILDVLLEYEAKATIKNNFGKISLDYAFNSAVTRKLERAIKYQVEELPITESEFVFIRSDDLADVFKEDEESDLASVLS
jgi:ankyrin repeat domain-containing protein 27